MQEINTPYQIFLCNAYRSVKEGKASWRQKAEEYTKTFHQYLTPNAIRKRSYRMVKSSLSGETPPLVKPVCSTESSTDTSKTFIQEYEKQDFNDGTIEAQKIVECKRELFNDKEKLLKYLGFNPNDWEFVHLSHSIWETQKKGGETKQLYSVRFKVKPRIVNELSEKDYLDIAKKLFNGNIPIFDCPKTDIITDKEKLLLIPQIEAHLGKLSNEIETGTNYDHNIVETRVEKVFKEAISIQRKNKCGKCLLVIGGDFFNSESNNQTTEGTPQSSTDTRFKKMFSVGLKLYTQGLLSLRSEFDDVDVLLCAGNHSRAMEFFLYIALRCYFHEDSVIHFSDDLKDTQSYIFGSCGLFFNHGDSNQKRLIASIPCEFPKEWGDTINRYLFLGHLHKLEVINSENGLTVHRVPAICENDAWHYQNRFGIGIVPQHELMVFNRKRGMLSNHYIYFDR